MSRLIRVNVFRKDNGKTYPDAKVEIGGHPELTTKTDNNGVATIIYPYDTGVVSIYVNGKEYFNDYISNIPPSGLVVVAPWSAW